MSFKIHFLAFPKGRSEEELAYVECWLMREAFTGDETKPQGGTWCGAGACGAGRGVAGPSRRMGGCAQLAGPQPQPLPLCGSAQVEARTGLSGSSRE